jgi:hypothetical protein
LENFVTAKILYHPIWGAVDSFVPMWRGRDYFPLRLLEAKLDGDRVVLRFEEIEQSEVNRALAVLTYLQTLEDPPCDPQQIQWMSELLVATL